MEKWQNKLYTTISSHKKESLNDIVDKNIADIINNIDGSDTRYVRSATKKLAKDNNINWYHIEFEYVSNRIKALMLKNKLVNNSIDVPVKYNAKVIGYTDIKSMVIMFTDMEVIDKLFSKHKTLNITFRAGGEIMTTQPHEYMGINMVDEAAVITRLPGHNNYASITDHKSYICVRNLDKSNEFE
jgi:hypothetical protein